MLTLLSDRYAPITSSLGFLELPLDEAAAGLLAWRKRLHGRVTKHDVTGALPELLDLLPPLIGGIRPRELLVGTENDRWTAYFDCGLQGSDPVSTVGHLSQELGCRGLVVVSIPHTKLRYGSVQFQLFGPDDTDFLNYVRTVSASFDTRWQFDVSGEVQPYEQVERYQARLVRDRLTSEMVADYAAALGIRPFDESSYTDRGVLVTSKLRVPRNGLVLSLAEARERHGIAPD